MYQCICGHQTTRVSLEVSQSMTYLKSVFLQRLYLKDGHGPHDVMHCFWNSILSLNVCILVGAVLVFRVRRDHIWTRMWGHQLRLASLFIMVQHTDTHIYQNENNPLLSFRSNAHMFIDYSVLHLKFEQYLKTFCNLFFLTFISIFFLYCFFSMHKVKILVCLQKLGQIKMILILILFFRQSH